MKDDIKLLLDFSNKINSEIVTLVRILLLVIIAYSIDGVQYRELKATLSISDGKLKSNLNKLAMMKYVEKSEVELDNKKLDIYLLTEEGRKELDKALNLANIIFNVVKKNVK